MEAGKRRLAGDTARAAITDEVKGLKPPGIAMLIYLAAGMIARLSNSWINFSLSGTWFLKRAIS